MNNRENLYNFTSIGKAIKEARINRGITRERLAEQLGMAARNLAEIENKGQHPRFQCFYELVTMFGISIDEFFYPATKPSVSSMRRNIDQQLDGLSDRELAIIDATIHGIHNSRKIVED